MGGQKMGIITLTTDFGGHYLGIMKAVIRRIDAHAEIYDITSEVGSFDVKGGAFALLSSYNFFPKGSVHLAVVDPGVGTCRKAIAVKTKNYTFVGPDNGLLALAARHDGVETIRELSNPRLHRSPVDPTFHGRDIFAPVAAYLAAGGDWEGVGGEVEDFLDLELVKRVGSNGKILCEVIFVDRFGNLTLSITKKDVELEGEVGVVFGEEKHRGRVVGTYDVGKEGLSILVGSAGYYEVAKRRGNAASELHAKAGDCFTLMPRNGHCEKR
jgi:S-adenosylmethionine hydrolase